MRVVVPHVGEPHVIQEAVLRQQGLSPWYEQLDKGDDYAYCRLLRSLWEEDRTFVIVEHDILPWPGAVQELMMCECLWGTYSYQTNGGTGVSHMLGCAKFTPGLISRLPGLWDQPRYWWELDQVLFFRARELGIEPHMHRPPVIHLNPRELGTKT